MEHPSDSKNVEVTIGQQTSILMDRLQTKEKVRIEFRDINYSIALKDNALSKPFRPKYKIRKILQNVSGHAESGELLALMGPSGSGKTSLLNILAARVPAGAKVRGSLKGAFKVNGQERNEMRFRRLSAYILQDDELYPFLTVKETLMLSANFYMPAMTTSEERSLMVRAVLNELGLEKVKDSLVGDDMVRGISGGERRRVSIGVQMMGDPSVLLLDEPTSGLDSYQAFNVMQSMKDLSERGRLVISVIHQPRSSIFNLFDRLMLLSEGRVCFFGDSKFSVDYFGSLGYECPESFNPADYFLDQLSADYRNPESQEKSLSRLRDLADKWEARGAELPEYISDTVAVKDSSVDVSDAENQVKTFSQSIRLGVRRVSLLFWRSFVQRSRTLVGLFAIQIIQALVSGLIIGWLYSGLDHGQRSILNRFGVFFYTISANAFRGVLTVGLWMAKEKRIMVKEVNNNAYTAGDFLLSKIFIELPFDLVPLLTYALSMYWIVGLKSDRAGYFILITWLFGVTTSSYGLLLGSIVPSPAVMAAIGPAVIIITLYFGGFYITVESLPVVASQLTYIAWSRWTFEAYSINEFEGQTFDCDSTNGQGCIRTGEQALETRDFGGHTTGYAIFCLSLILFGYLVCAYIALEMAGAEYMSLGHEGKTFSSAAAVRAAGQDALPEAKAILSDKAGTIACEASVSLQLEVAIERAESDKKSAVTSV